MLFRSSSVDEQIYHEALVHPTMAKVIDPKRVLILGGWSWISSLWSAMKCPVRSSEMSGGLE